MPGPDERLGLTTSVPLDSEEYRASPLAQALALSRMRPAVQQSERRRPTEVRSMDSQADALAFQRMLLLSLTTGPSRSTPEENG